MNRLWVWFSLVIGLVVVIAASSPVIYRTLVPPLEHPLYAAPPELPSQDLETFQQQVENRMLSQVSRNLLLGALVGLLVGV